MAAIVRINNNFTYALYRCTVAPLPSPRFICPLALSLSHRLLVLPRCFTIFEPGLRRAASRSSLQRKSHERDYRADGSKRMYIVTFREALYIPARLCVSRMVVIAFHRCFTFTRMPCCATVQREFKAI